jgi:ribonuclease G
MCKKLPTAHHPSKILSELNRTSSILRDVFNDSFTGIYIDDEELFEQTKESLEEIAPDKVSIVKLYQSREIPFLKNTISKDKLKRLLENRVHEQRCLFDY